MRLSPGYVTLFLLFLLIKLFFLKEKFGYDFGHAVAKAFWQQVEKAQKKGFLTILWVDERVWRTAMNIFQKYDDQDFSFTDCTSFVLAQEHKVDEVFTFDHHFLMFGFLIKPIP
jgi:predicted nucleic acid-binding protein